MKQLLIFILFSISTSVNAQFKSIDFVAGTNYSYRIESYNNNSDNLIKRILGKNSSDDPKFNYIVGLNVNYAMNDKLDFKTGIRYTEIGYYETANFIGCGIAPIAPTSGSIKSAIINKYIEIPLSFRVNKIQTIGLATYFEFGIAPSYFIEHSRYTKSDMGKHEYTPDHSYAKLHVPFVASIGTEYTFNKHSVFGQLVSKSGIAPNETDSNSRERFFEIGIEVGFRYQFSKEDSFSSSLKI